MRRADLQNERFGSLTVIAPATRQDGKNYRWLCRCDCGNLSEVTTTHLRSGHTRSCGHCQTFSFSDGFVRCTLPNGRSFVFDAADYPLIKQYSWRVDEHGYVRSWCKEYGHFKLHRLLMGFDSAELVDHINGNPADNRRENLRLATPEQNAQNSAMRKDNMTGFKGVTRHVSGKYQSRINVAKHCISLGYFNDPVSAAQAYDEAARRYHGEYARLNFM